MAEETERSRKQSTDRAATKRPAQKANPQSTRAEEGAARTSEPPEAAPPEAAARAPETHEPVRTTRWDGFGAAAHAVLRIGAGLLFMQHGVQKLFGWLGGFGGEPGGTAELFSLMGLAGVLEVFGGLLIVLGLLTRPVAVLLVIEMLAAFFMAHAPQGGFPIQNQGELPLLFALIFLFLAANGPGPASLDRSIRKNRRAG